MIPAHQISLTREITLKKEFEAVTERKIPRTRNQRGLGIYASPNIPLKMLPKTEVDKLHSSSGSQQRKSIRIIKTERKSKRSHSKNFIVDVEHLETDPSASKENMFKQSTEDYGYPPPHSEKKKTQKSTEKSHVRGRDISSPRENVQKSRAFK